MVLTVPGWLRDLAVEPTIHFDPPVVPGFAGLGLENTNW